MPAPNGSIDFPAYFTNVQFMEYGAGHKGQGNANGGYGASRGGQQKQISAGGVGSLPRIQQGESTLRKALMFMKKGQPMEPMADLLTPMFDNILGSAGALVDYNEAAVKAFDGTGPLMQDGSGQLLPPGRLFAPTPGQVSTKSPTHGIRKLLEKPCNEGPLEHSGTAMKAFCLADGLLAAGYTSMEVIRRGPGPSTPADGAPAIDHILRLGFAALYKNVAKPLTCKLDTPFDIAAQTHRDDLLAWLRTIGATSTSAYVQRAAIDFTGAEELQAACEAKFPGLTFLEGAYER